MLVKWPTPSFVIFVSDKTLFVFTNSDSNDCSKDCFVAKKKQLSFLNTPKIRNAKFGIRETRRRTAFKKKFSNPTFHPENLNSCKKDLDREPTNILKTASFLLFY